MILHRLAAGICLTFFFCTLSPEQACCSAASAVPEKTAVASEVAAGAENPSGPKADAVQPSEAGAGKELDERPQWERRYIKETRITIENNMKSLMDGINSRADLATSVDTFVRTWDKWAESQLFILDNARDIDVYGNLYSLQVMCRTLRLAAEDWHAEDATPQSKKTLEKAAWLEVRSRRLAEPVAEIIRRQSYSSYLPRRIEIMQDMLPYVDICYKDKLYEGAAPQALPQ